MAYVHRHVMDAAQAGADRAGVPQHLLPADPAAAEALLPVRAGDPQGGRGFPGDERVGVLASGGLSHFLVDEDFDRAILKACADKDAEFLQTLPRNKLQRRQLGNPQLGRGRRRGRAPRPRTGSTMSRAIARRPAPAPA